MDEMRGQIGVAAAFAALLLQPVSCGEIVGAADFVVDGPDASGDDADQVDGSVEATDDGRAGDRSDEREVPRTDAGEEADAEADPDDAPEGGDCDTGPEAMGDVDAEEPDGPDPDSGTDAARACPELVWCDESSGFMWIVYEVTMADWSAAIVYCDLLEAAGTDDWRLPSISELRTLVRGCPDVEPGGTCPVTDDCHEPPCIVSGACAGCTPGGGPGVGGCYWTDGFPGGCGTWGFWSSTANGPDFAWFLEFRSAVVTISERRVEFGARCVANWP